MVLDVGTDTDKNTVLSRGWSSGLYTASTDLGSHLAHDVPM
jgi:hypothetical protein